MPPLPPQRGQQHGPSNIDKLKMGAIMGGTVGAIMGFLYGTVTIFRYGAGPNGIGRTLGQYMLASGSTFGFFMAIGSVIRHDAPSHWPQQAHLRHPRAVVIAQAPARKPDHVRAWGC